MKKIVEVCVNCGKKSCDGLWWKVIRVVSLRTRKDTDKNGKIDKAWIDCTLHLFHTKHQYQNQPIGTIVVRDFKNWCEPARVTLERIEEPNSMVHDVESND